MTHNPVYDYGGQIYSYAHYGYLDGIQGRDPNPRLEGVPEYDEGWLRGEADRDNPERLSVLDEVVIKKGDTVLIPKGTLRHSMKDGNRPLGRTTKVTLHDVYPMIPAYIDHRTNDFTYPEAPKVTWAGAGGYWCRADVRAVTKVEE